MITKIESSRLKFLTNYLLAIGYCLLAIGKEGEFNPNCLCKEVILFGENCPGPYNLPDRFILIGSDSVFINDSLVAKDSYQINYNAGTIIFAETIPEKDKILIRYQRIPALNLAKNYSYYIDTLKKGQRNEPESLEQALFRELKATQYGPNDEGKPLISPGFNSPKADFWGFKGAKPLCEEDLMVSGSKSIGFSVGSEQGLGIEQATRLNLVGQIAGVSLSAALSDQSSPIPPEGVTKEISELDKISINVKKGKWSGVFGDYDLAMDLGSFGTKASRLIGVQVKGSLAKADFLSFYARPKGKFQRLLIIGKDGVQGPYCLKQSIVPASEIVYLDGEKMTRGYDEDYTIDYSLGEITFTNKRIITDQSRIYVTYEYTFDAYDRSAYGVSASYTVSPLTIGIKNFSEVDNQNRSFTYDFSLSDIETLAMIGDDTSRAWLNGARYVGIGHGDYRKVNGYYQYVGPKNGDYEIVFTYVGDSLGDYIYNDSFYLYTGPNSGQYVAKRRIILPEKNEIYLGHFGLNTKSKLGEFGLSLEGSMSQKDYNLFSNFSDEDNNGFAYSLVVALSNASNGFTYKRKFTPKNYTNTARSQEIDFIYNWGGIDESERLSSDEITGFYQPFSNFSLIGEIGWLKQSVEETLSLRKRFLTGAKLFWVDYKISKVSDILRQNLSVRPRIKFLYPEFLLAKEERQTSRSLTINPNLGFKPSEKINAFISFDLTSDEKKDSIFVQFKRASIRRIYQIDIKTMPLSGLSLAGVLGRSTKHYYESAGTDWHQYFADFSLNYSSLNRITTLLDYHLSNKQTQEKQAVYIKVEPGSGDYKRNPETNEFYPDPNGDYKRVIEPTARISRSQEQNWQANLDCTIFKPLSLAALFNLNQEKTDTAIISKMYNHELRLEISRQPRVVGQPFRVAFFGDSKGQSPFVWGQGLLGVSLTNNYYNSLDYQYTSSSNWQNQNSLKFQIRISPELNLSSGFEFNLRKRQQIISNQEREKKVFLEPCINYGFFLQIPISFTWRHIRYSYYPDFELRIADFGLKRRFEYKKNMVIVTELIFTNRSATIDKLPFEIALNDPLGLTKRVSLSLDQMISKELVFSAGYSLLDRPDRSPEHNLSVNLKAYF